MAENNAVEKNIGLVHLCARKFLGKGIEYDDLFQAGCVGLIKAAENFDDTRGFQFSTYAVPVILGEVRRLFREGGAVKVSRTVGELAQKIKYESERIQKETGESPQISTIAENLGVSIEKIVLAMEASRVPVSLTGSDDEEDIAIRVEAPEEKLTESMTLIQIISSLPEEDRKLIVYRYYKSKTQSDTAKLLGITQVQVSRREKKILEYMRSSFS